MDDFLHNSFSKMCVSKGLKNSKAISISSLSAESCVSGDSISTKTLPISEDKKFLFEDFDSDDELDLPTTMFSNKANKENNDKPATSFNLAEYLRSVDEQCGVAHLTQTKKVKPAKQQKPTVNIVKPKAVNLINHEDQCEVEEIFLSTSEKVDRLPITDPRLEELDPNPDIHKLFATFDQKFFEGLLIEKGIQLKWAKNLTSTAGAYYRQKKTIKLSERLIQQRPRSDLVNTLLHEMIHAYVHQKGLPGSSHGTSFLLNMNRINKAAGTDITVFHSWRAEVKALKKYHWRCTGQTCQAYGPTRGIISLPTQRKPNRFDHSFRFHEKYNCSGTFESICDNFTT